MGMLFPPSYFAGAADRSDDVQIFLLRNGIEAGRWPLHEESDARDQPGGVQGLEGLHDLFGAIGVYGKTAFEVRFGRHNWEYSPPRE